MNLKPGIFVLAFFMVLPYVMVANEVWNQKASFGGSARHRSTAFSIGNKGYIGLGHINALSNIEYEDFWEYDPGTNSWTQKANFGGGLRYHSIGFSVGSKGYVGMGREEDGDYENDLWEFDPLANTWLQKSNCPGGDRRGSVVFVINGIAYVGSGEVQGGAISNEFYAYDASGDFWYQVATFPGTERTSAVAFSIGDKGYFGTGGLGFGSTDFWEYDPLSDQWTQLADVGTTPRMEACGFAVNGKGYIGTGDDFSSGNNYSDFWEYNPATGLWKQISDFPGIARRYMVAFVIGNKAYAGVGTNGTNFRDFWEFDLLLNSEQIEASSGVSVYPNPASEFITVSMEPNGNDCLFELIDMSGSLVFSQPLVSNHTTFACPNLPAAHYLFSIKRDNIILKSGTLILQ